DHSGRAIHGSISNPHWVKDQSQQPGWVKLFNGRDLTGWKYHPEMPGDWKVENGILKSGGSKTNHLFTERNDYAKFHLRAEVRINPQGDSGILFRTSWTPVKLFVGEKWFLTASGLEAQIFGGINHTFAGGNTGSFHGKQVVNAPDPTPPDEWMQIEVIA